MDRLGCYLGTRTVPRASMRFAIVLLAGVTPLAIPAQSPRGSGTSIALLNLAFYGQRATELKADDSLLAHAATASMRDYLRHVDGVTLTDSAVTAAAERSQRALDAAAGKPCNVIVACARAVGQELGVRWVVMAKVSKTTDLIWVLSGQLIDVPTGKLVYDDVYELKGNAHDIVPKGARVWAQRITERIASPSTP
ncbi:MAG TPA: DUF2380 domain-containing protein [Gemmatimonadaceae bacterium]